MEYCYVIGVNALFIQKNHPSLIKYMGSKSKILDFIIEGINSVPLKQNTILDLFAGSATLSGAIGGQSNFISNDIQNYSSILSKTYLTSLKSEPEVAGDKILAEAKDVFLENLQRSLVVDYSEPMTLEQFNFHEKEQQNLINENFNYEYHLFAKNYSGTWWSYEQCVWIDAIKEVADRYKSSKFYPFILSALMYAMAYSSQGTGHYAQYRDAKTFKSMTDISIYRKKKLENIFVRKLSEILEYGRSKEEFNFKNQYLSLDYKDALDSFTGGTVYADPPYCFVHYSRFYHALETLVLYDYPEIQKISGEMVKGRYRKERHQSPFSIKTQVEDAFVDMFKKIKKTESNLVLSYSNTGMIDLERLSDIASSFWDSRNIEIITTNHQHMTLGRQGKRFRDVIECVFIAQ